MQYNSFLTFLFSLVPGGGQMYMGLMKRGMQIMALFFAIFTLTIGLDIPSIGIPLLFLVWFYNFFDTIHIRRAFQKGEVVPDAGFIDIEIEAINSYHIGMALVIAGLLAALRSLNNGILLSLDPAYRFFLQQVWNLIPSALLILGGLYLLQNRKK